MNRKGFTLIELLAIIVILAIIAVITVPIILGIIDESKQKSVINSAYGYKDAINKLYATKLLNNKDYKMINKVYTVSELNTEGLNVSGNVPDNNSWIQIENNNVKSGCLQFDEYKVDITNGNVGSAQKAQCGSFLAARYASLIVTSGDGLYESETEPGRLIYRGQDPNNRIFLKEDGTNNTLYRIVSFEADGTIKVVRDDKLSSNMAWDSRDSDTTKGPRKNAQNTYCNYGETTDEYKGCNAWGTGSNTLYNGAALGNSFHYFYYSSPTATNFSTGATGTVTINSTLNTYLNDTWLPSSLTNYIDDHSWNVGGIYYTTNDKGIVKEKEEEKQLKWIGKVGLLNITEYAESSTNPDCTNARLNYGSASGSPCKIENYNYKSSYHQWSLSPDSGDRRYVWNVSSAGYFGYSNASGANGVRPAFYLKSQINLSGSGAQNDEYTID